ncbi:MAG: S-layer homology domain-containing protein [Cyanobacteria bacterium J06639_16]
MFDSRLVRHITTSTALSLTIGMWAGTATPSLSQSSISESQGSPVEVAQAVAFSDIGGNLYEAEIIKAAQLGFIAGPGDGTFRPNNTVTREQAVSIILSYLDVTDADLAGVSNPFRDVPGDRWSEAKIAFAAENGIVAGRGNGRFDPTATVTRAELMAMLSNAHVWRGGEGSSGAPNFDFSDISGHWAEGTVLGMSSMCGGVARPLNERGNSFAPNTGATRAYTAAAIVRLADCQAYESGTASADTGAGAANPSGTSGTIPPENVATTQGLGALNQSQVNELLAAHNRYRSEVGVSSLTWSADLSLSAQQWADQLASTGSFEHSTGNGYGENLALNSNPSLTVLVDQWGAEKADYIPGVPFSQASTGGVIGHYTQIVWRDTTEVGCGVAIGSYQGFDATFLVCQYNPPGNYSNQVPY